MKKFFLGLCVCMIILFANCREFKSSVSSAIAKRVSIGEGTIINVAKLTDFDWDKLYVFGPYSSRDVIQKVIGIRFLATNEISMGVSEGDCFLVFMKNNRVIHYFSHPRACGDFSDLEPIFFTPKNAKFTVVHEGYSLY